MCFLTCVKGWYVMWVGVKCLVIWKKLRRRLKDVEEGKQDNTKMIIYKMVYLPVFYGSQSCTELTRRDRIKVAKFER
jgi:allophanate hydrolase subunit 1